jgi:hypothetical protein
MMGQRHFIRNGKKPSGKYKIHCTQGQGSVVVAECSTLTLALTKVEQLKGQGSFAIQYPDGRWHKWAT